MAVGIRDAQVGSGRRMEDFIEERRRAEREERDAGRGIIPHTCSSLELWVCIDRNGLRIEMRALSLVARDRE